MQLIFALLCCFCAFINLASLKPVEEDEKSIEDTTILLELMQAALSEDDHEKANKEFREQFGECEVTFSHVAPDKRHSLVAGNSISIDFGISSDFLKAFGQSIKKVSIVYNLVGDTTAQVFGNLLNTYCADTLEVFEAKAYKHEMKAFNEMETPFKNVKTVTFIGTWNEVDDGRLGLDQLFPAMEVLNLEYDYGYIFHRKYPNLVEINAAKPTTDDFKVLIENNPQLKRLNVETTTVDFIKNVQEKLPELQKFSFNMPSDVPSYEGPVIEFDKVEDLFITDYPHNIRFGKLSFKNLKRIELRVEGNIKDEYIQLMESNKGLEYIEISDGTLNDVTILGIAMKCPNVIEAKINCDTGVSAKSIWSFIKNKKRIKSLVLELKDGSVTFFKSLKKEMNDKWKLDSIDRHYKKLKATKLEEFDSLGGDGSETEGAPNTSSLGGSNNQNNNQNNQNNQNNPGNNTSDPQSTTQQPGGAATVLLSKTLIVIFCGIITKSFVQNHLNRINLDI